MSIKSTARTPQGLTKVIVAQTASDLSSAVTVAKAEAAPKTPDINDKSYANKRQKDL